MMKLSKFASIPIAGALLLSTADVSIMLTHGGVEIMHPANAEARYVRGGPGAHSYIHLNRHEMSSTELADVIAHYLAKPSSN